MKTIRQIAEEIGVSRQAVYYRIKKPPLSHAMQSLVSKERTGLTVSFDGEKLIKQAFNKSVAVKELSKETDSFDSSMIELLCDAIDGLKMELKDNSKQTAELNATMKMQVKTARFKPKKKPIPLDKKPTVGAKASIPIRRLSQIGMGKTP